MDTMQFYVIQTGLFSETISFYLFGSDAGEARTRRPSVSSQALYYWVTGLL